MKIIRMFFSGERRLTFHRPLSEVINIVRQSRCALSAIDSKRFVWSDLVSTRALGHHLNEYEVDFEVHPDGF